MKLGRQTWFLCKCLNISYCMLNRKKKSLHSVCRWIDQPGELNVPAGSSCISTGFRVICARRPAIWFSDELQPAASPLMTEDDLDELHYHLIFELAPITQTTSYPQQPHTHYPHCLEQTQTHHPTKWKQLLSNLFHLLQYFAKLSNAHTPPLNKPVRFYHTLLFLSSFFFFFLQLPYSVELCFRFYTLYSAAFVVC